VARAISHRVVAITGGARGIGRATALALARRGARVAIGDLDAPLARAVAAGLGGRAVGLELDVRSPASWTAFLAEAEAALGPLDVLVNNAGVLHVGPFLEEDEAWTRRQIEVNVLGVVFGMRAVLPGMRGRGTGHVVNVASAAARIGVPNEAVYAATKHAVAGLSESVRQELRGSGVEVSLVMPGLVRTELAAGTTGARATVVLEPEDVAAAIVAALERPRFDVFVPRAYGGILRAGALPPRRAREALLRLAGSERPTTSTTPADRAAYEDRVATFAPGSGRDSAP
jgi:NADP-dependent 3-hydroxy acid dehydrogenase YdfG